MDRVLPKSWEMEPLPWDMLPPATHFTDCRDKGGAARTLYQTHYQPLPQGIHQSLTTLSGLKRAWGQNCCWFFPLSKYLRLCACRRSPDNSPWCTTYRKPAKLWFLEPASEWRQKETVIWIRLSTPCFSWESNLQNATADRVQYTMLANSSQARATCSLPLISKKATCKGSKILVSHQKIHT